MSPSNTQDFSKALSLPTNYFEEASMHIAKHVGGITNFVY